MTRAHFTAALLAALALITTTTAAHSQPLPPEIAPVAPVETSYPGMGLSFSNFNAPPGFLTGTRDFQNFTGFISNPIQSIDPRSQTAIWPIFGSAWASGSRPALPDANMQIYGAGVTIALSDRLAVGMNQGGYAVLDVNSNVKNLLAARGLPVPDRDRSGRRAGWLNLGGFAQYTLIANCEKQFLLTAGLRWEAPSGATQMFQGGANPTYLSPYVTVGKAFGCWHVLATTGYEFPAGSGDSTVNTFYANVHIDRKIGRLFPLVEINSAFHNKSTDINLPTGHGVLDIGTFSSSGNLVTLAAGANVMLVPGRVELGAVYICPLASQGRVDFNSLLVKMVYRY